MLLFGSRFGSIRHSQHNPGSDRSRKLHGLGYFSLGGSQLLRTCEVRDRSWLAVEG